MKQADARRITVRSHQHTCGTLLALLKAHPETARAIRRHSRISMTMDAYTHARSATATGIRHDVSRG
ncbi:hypothetical protein [Streptomyces europaeiscabiei]|uniref:hypothetical protein n=1 Tax=Streptomyces europaeiscabiei TaxID=146819 RepID=UPI002E167B8F|nr:hypothetical protein OHB30_24820 [Streptomyces europaeiscabiei]